MSGIRGATVVHRLAGPALGALAVGPPVPGADIEPRPGRSLGAAVLCALAPVTAFMVGSHMNHVATLAWLLLRLAVLPTLAVLFFNARTTGDPRLLGYEMLRGRVSRRLGFY